MGPSTGCALLLVASGQWPAAGAWMGLHNVWRECERCEGVMLGLHCVGGYVAAAGAGSGSGGWTMWWGWADATG